MKTLIKAARYLFIVVSAVALLILGLNFWIVLTTSDFIYHDISELPNRKVALLLGTSKSTTHGGVNKYFEERINATAELYHRGVIGHVIVSGDNNTIYYNEPKDMLKALKDLGVAPEDLTLDFAGFRTLDSVIRAKLIFGQDELLIITQDFHCYRALFIAQYFDIDAVAFAADNRDELPLTLAAREILARAMAVIDLYILKSQPKFLGDKEQLPINN